MSANVRCAGGGQWSDDGPPPGRDVLPVTPCTWTGERLRGLRHRGDWYLTNAIVKPCPRCGGRVELIPTGGGA